MTLVVIRWSGLCTTVLFSVSVNVVVRGLAVDTETGQVYFTHSNKVDVVNANNTGRHLVRNMKAYGNVLMPTYGVAVDSRER